MSHLLATDLHDALLQPLASTYLADVESWIIETASAAGVAESEILSTLGTRAKRAAVLQLAVLTCLGECGQNQRAFGGDGKDVFLVKLGAYQKQLDSVLAHLTSSDWSGSIEAEDQTPRRICAEIFRA